MNRFFYQLRRRFTRSNAYRKAVIELDVLDALYPEPDNRPIIAPYRKEILALVDAVNKRGGHSGGSMPFAASAVSQAVKKLILHEPIAPITDEEKYWVNVTQMLPPKSEPMYQHQRDSRVFKEGDQYTYVDAIVWKTQKGTTWTGSCIVPGLGTLSHKQLIKSFPFEPKTFTVDVIEEEIAPDDWQFTVKSIADLKEVFDYYDPLYLKQYS